jgi:hypothetical protein
MNSPLLIKSKTFALQIIKVCNEVKSNKRESVLKISFCAQEPALVPISERLFMPMDEQTL